MKTRKKIGKLVDIRDIWKKLTDPEKDDEIEEVNNPDTEEFIRNLTKIQIKTGTIETITEGNKTIKKQKKYKIKNKEKTRGEGDSHTKDQERD